MATLYQNASSSSPNGTATTANSRTTSSVSVAATERTTWKPGGQTRLESFLPGLYSYQILYTYLNDFPTEVPTGLDPVTIFMATYLLLWFHIWAMLRALEIQRSRCTNLKLKKVGHVKSEECV
ncbi:hypothetical protein OROHE_001945 [Orobanche hederae]